MFECVANPFRFVAGVGKLTRRPLRDHDRLGRIDRGYFLVGPFDQGKKIRPGFIGELLAVDAQPEPVDISGAGIIGGRRIPFIDGIGIIVGLEEPLDVVRAAGAHPRRRHSGKRA